MKHNKVTQLDRDQIVKYAYDEDKQANRVTIVDGIKIDTTNIETAITDAFGRMDMGKINFASQQAIPNFPSVQVVQVPQIVKEYETIEKPVYINEVKVIEIEKPILVETIKYIEVEKQIVVKEQLIVEVKIPEIIREYEKIPLWAKISLAAFLGMSLLTNIILLIKK